MLHNYDVIHFEALGEEAHHLREETEAAQAKGLLPRDLRYLIVPDALQVSCTAPRRNASSPHYD
ncbi:MAG: hypothetical protein V8S34_06885 [Lawsonibacter sp.]